MSRRSSWDSWAQAESKAIRYAQRWRSVTEREGAGILKTVHGQSVVSFASNDYLGLGVHPSVRDAAIRAIQRYGTSTASSRVVAGTLSLHLQLEEAIAKWQRMERALVFPTGFAANVGVLSVLGTADVTVFSDELNHASIIDGCRLSKAKVVVYRHRDVDHLHSLLCTAQGRKLVVSDGVFSMDGDIAPIEDLSLLCARHDALLVLDEAHSVLEPIRHDDVCEVIRTGTLSKTLGALGGWVAGSHALIDVLINRARTFIYTTGLTPPDAAAALAALNIVVSDEGARLRNRLKQSIQLFLPLHRSPIVPFMVGDDRAVLDIAAHLDALGFHVPAIRPPTVAPGTARLRIALTAVHTDEMILKLKSALSTLPCMPLVPAA